MASFLGVPTIGHGLFLKVDKRQGVLHAILDKLLFPFRDTRSDQYRAVFGGLDPLVSLLTESIRRLIRRIVIALVTVYLPPMAEDLFLPRSAEKEDIAIRGEVHVSDGDVLPALEQIRVQRPHDRTARVILHVADDIVQLPMTVTYGVIVVVLEERRYAVRGVVLLALLAGGMDKAITIKGIRQAWRIHRAIDTGTRRLEITDNKTYTDIHGLFYLKDAVEMVGHDLMTKHTDVPSAGALNGGCLLPLVRDGLTKLGQYHGGRRGVVVQLAKQTRTVIRDNRDEVYSARVVVLPHGMRAVGAVKQPTSLFPICVPVVGHRVC